MSNNQVYVLTENHDDDGFSVIGVYETYELAEQEKFAIIRDYFDIDESEVADKDLDDEVSGAVTYDIVQRSVIGSSDRTG
jgi:hypothetical protein